MSTFKTWSHLWFGCWSEFGERYSDCPSISNFVDISWNYGRLDKVVTYLRNAPIIATTSRLAIPWAVGNGDGRSSISFRSDGMWLWLDDLDYYVLQHHVRLPDRFVKHMESANYKVPEEITNAQALEWPPIK